MWLLSTFILYISIDIAKSTVDYLQHPVKTCRIGDEVKNECNKCLCTSKTVFECTPLDCNRNKTAKESEVTKQLCYPNQLYVQNLITCICTKDGRWPHKSCQDTFQSLPPSNVVKHKCEPDTYVTVDCNVCRCGPNGEIISERCTRNACDDDVHRRANFGTNNVYSNCEMKNWYSLAPCQFCFCVNQNKLVCNTGNYYSKKLELGSYNLRICGKDLIREAIELIPDNQRLLRLGLILNNTSTTAMQRAVFSTDATTKRYAEIHEDHNIAIEVNRESNENQTVFYAPKSENASSSSEYYSDSDEEQLSQQKKQPPLKPTVRTIVTTTTVQTMATNAQDLKDLSSTKFPFEEGDEMLNESAFNNDEDNEDSSEMDVELDQGAKTTTEITLNALPEAKPIPGTVKGPNSAESYQYVGNTLKINLPQVLNKVFQLALRKSMVSLTKETKCTPGTTSVHDCNMCFCLKNSKLLCTNNPCVDEKNT